MIRKAIPVFLTACALVLTQSAALATNQGNSLSHDQILLMMVQIGVLLLASFVTGEIMLRIGQPPVIGQLLSGIVLGHSVFGKLCPELSSMIFRADPIQFDSLGVVSWLGAIFLLMLAGMEMDLDVIRKQGRPVVMIALAASIIPFAVAFGCALCLPQSLVGPTNNGVLTALFIATLFSMSSVPVIAKILGELNLLRRDVGQIIVASALVHDGVGYILLGFVAALIPGGSSGAGSLAPLMAPLGVISFLAILYFAKERIYDGFRRVAYRARTDDALLTMVAVLVMFGASATQYIGIHVVVGAFAIGVLLGRLPLIRRRVTDPLKNITNAVFAPIFFASAGLTLDFTRLADAPNLAVLCAFVLVASASKISACLIGGKLSGLDRWESLFIGVGTNAFGAVGIVVAMVGRSLNLIGDDLATIIVAMSIISTIITPSLLKLIVLKLPAKPTEQERLRQEHENQRSIIGQIGRILIPVDSEETISRLSLVLRALGRSIHADATALQVMPGQPGNNRPGRTFSPEVMKGFGHINLISRVSDAASPEDGILAELDRGYDLVLLDSPMNQVSPVQNNCTRNCVYSEFALSPYSVLVYSSFSSTEVAPLRAMRKIFVPISGTLSSITAAEIAVLIALSEQAMLTIAHVCESGEVREISALAPPELLDIKAVIEKLVDGCASPGGEVMEHSMQLHQTIIRLAQQVDPDLIVVTSRPRLGQRAYRSSLVRRIVDAVPGADLLILM